MRRYFFIILFLVVLVAPFLLRLMVGGGGDGNAARRQSPRRLVVMTPHSEGIRREFQDGFSDWLKSRNEPDVFIDYRNLGGGANDIVKYFDANASLYPSTKTFGIDLVWGGGDYLFDEQLKKPTSFPGGYLQKVALPPGVLKAAYPTPDIGGVPLYDEGGCWFGTALSAFGIVYNKDVLRTRGLPEPKTWADLADPRYQGWLVLADPSRSASVKTAFMTIVERSMADAWEADAAAQAKHADLKKQQAAAEAANDAKAAAGHKAAAYAVYQAAMDPGWRRGMGLIRQIASNTRVFTDNSASVPGTVGSGDAAAGMAIDFYGRTEVQSVGADRVGYVEPAGATIVNPDPIAVVRRDDTDSPAARDQLALAVKFVEFILSEPGQRLWNTRAGAPGGPRETALYRRPIVRSAYGDTTNFTDRVNVFEVAGSFNTRRDRRDTNPILAELIQASCLDLLDELKDTRRAILASPRAAELDARLGTFPFGQAEALARQAAYVGTKAKPVPPIDRLATMRRWEDEFAAEYAGLRAEAAK
ncbi:MAG: iron transporter substrate-binding protein [Phycisphaerales bacterium]|nr:iron transporter substrate-binding protein [Phycisphaerales bacterium]